MKINAFYTVLSLYTKHHLKFRKNQAFANAYDEAIKTLKENGTLEKLSQKYFGENIFSFVE